MWRAWEIGSHTFPIVRVLFSLLDSNPRVYFKMCEIHGFYRQLRIAWKNAAKSIELGGPGKLAPIFSATYGYFFPIRFPSYGIPYHMGNAWIFPSISNTIGICSKIHPVISQFVFPEHYFFYLFSKSDGSLKGKTEKTDKADSRRASQTYQKNA